MAVALRQSRRFWVANCVGFSLTGGCRGTVERVLADDDPHTPSQLEVRMRHRLRRVPASAVVAVVPSERVLVVERSGQDVPSQSGERLVRTGQVAQRGLVAAGALLLIAAVRGWRLARAGWRVAFPVVVSASRRGGSEAVRLVRSVPWQEYGRSARSATTRLSQGRSRPSSPPHTMSSGRSSARSSRDRARTTSSG
jgi:hypothetical protein